MLKIGLVEPYHHGEVLFDFCELLLGLQDIELFIFTQQYILDHAPKSIREGKNIHIYGFQARHRKKFFKQQKCRLNCCNLIIWITARPEGWISRLALAPPIILMVHNRYTWFEPLQHLHLSLNSPVRLLVDLAGVIRLVLFQRKEQKRILDRASAIAFTSQNILNFALDKGHLYTSGKAIFLPFSCYRGRAAEVMIQENIPLCIVVPGTVDGRVRDYELLAEAFGQVVSGLSYPVELVLLGKLKHKLKGVEKLQKLQWANFQVTIFKQWVPQIEYEENMKRAAFLILPLRVFKQYGVVREKTGESTISGGVNDMVRFGIPAICSKHYSLDEGLEQIVAQYDDQSELVHLLHVWINNKSFWGIRYKMDRVLDPYRCDYVRLALIKQLKEIAAISTKGK